MARYKEFHSSKTKSAGDCVIRSIMACTGYTWERVFWDLCNIARKKQCMPNDKPVYDAWFKANGFKKCKSRTTRTTACGSRRSMSGVRITRAVRHA